jgi:hypothetical protein
VNGMGGGGNHEFTRWRGLFFDEKADSRLESPSDIFLC